MKKVPEPVVELVNHLRSTGTGEAKLELLEQIGRECGSNRDIFMHEVSKQMAQWPATIAKIKKFTGADTPDYQQQAPVSTFAESSVTDANVEPPANFSPETKDEPKSKKK